MNDTEPIQRAIFLRELGKKIRSRVLAEGAQVPQFLAAVDARLEKGAVEYGDTSPSKNYSVLVDEVQQELLDVAGWACQMWRKVNASVRDGETLHDRHPKVLLAQTLMEEAAEAFASWEMWRGKVAVLCKELDARA